MAETAVSTDNATVCDTSTNLISTSTRLVVVFYSNKTTILLVFWLGCIARRVRKFVTVISCEQWPLIPTVVVSSRFQASVPQSPHKMELQDTFYSKSEYVETVTGSPTDFYYSVFIIHLLTIFTWCFQTTGNKVSRQAQIYGSQNIILNGKVILQSGVMIRGDLASVKMGRYCFVGRGSVVRPPCKKFSGG